MNENEMNEGALATLNEWTGGEGDYLYIAFEPYVIRDDKGTYTILHHSNKGSGYLHLLRVFSIGESWAISVDYEVSGYKQVTP